jgi:DNA-binding MarR family transcriptional regulator
MSDNTIAIPAGTIRDELERLFEEAVDLGNCLKRRARQTHRGERLSASGRILLQTLRLNGPQTVPALAHIRSTSRQNIQILTDRLASLGHVEFVANPQHATSDLVRLTASGEAMLQDANAREASALAALLPHTSEDEVRDAAELLRRLRSLITGERKAGRPRPVEPVSERDAEPEPPNFAGPEELPVTLL